MILYDERDINWMGVIMVVKNALIFKLKINLNDSIKVESQDKTIVQILFDGDASGEYFNGRIMPGGVDTQEIYPDGSGSLSARYCIAGIDCEGQECKIYISNTAKLNDSRTVPTIVTDSKALDFLNNAKLRGEIVWISGQMYINIYAD